MKNVTLILAFVFVGCHHTPSAEHEEPQNVLVDEIPDDIKIPKQLWDQVQSEDGPLGEHAKAAPKKKEENKEETVIEDDTASKGTILFSTVTVVLKEHNPEVLANSEIRIQLPRGGGKIDISKYISDRPGSFFVRFEWPEWGELKDVRSFYVSRARKRKLDGELYGVGCNKFLDISSRVSRENGRDGIKVNTTRERHVTVLSGHFVFSAKKEKQTFLTQVTFTDSKNTNLQCEDVKKL